MKAHSELLGRLSAPSAATLAILAFALFFPSLSVVERFLGPPWALAYVLTGLAYLVALALYGLPRLPFLLGERAARWLMAATLLALLVAFLLVYPVADSGIVGGGSDRDDALNLAARELWQGRSPYYPRTYLENPISPLPGSVLLALPFVFLGNSAYQNLFWLGAFFLVASRHLRDGRSALAMLWTVLVLSPAVLNELVTGGDLLANALFCTVFTLLFVTTAAGTDALWKRVGAAILFGVSLSSRANFLLVLPIAAAWLARKKGLGVAFSFAGVAALAFAGITLPFWLYDPAGFSPLHTANKLAGFNDWIPYSGSLALGLSVAIALGLASWRSEGSLAELLQRCAVAQAVPVVLLVGLSSLHAGSLDLVPIGYGLSFLTFGVLGAWLRLAARSPAPAVVRATPGDEGGAPRPEGRSP